MFPGVFPAGGDQTPCEGAIFSRFRSCVSLGHICGFSRGFVPTGERRSPAAAYRRARRPPDYAVGPVGRRLIPNVSLSLPYRDFTVFPGGLSRTRTSHHRPQGPFPCINHRFYAYKHFSSRLSFPQASKYSRNWERLSHYLPGNLPENDPGKDPPGKAKYSAPPGTEVRRRHHKQSPLKIMVSPVQVRVPPPRSPCLPQDFPPGEIWSEPRPANIQPTRDVLLPVTRPMCGLGR